MKEVTIQQLLKLWSVVRDVISNIVCVCVQMGVCMFTPTTCNQNIRFLVSLEMKCNDVM